MNPQINPQSSEIDLNDPKVQQAWAYFQKLQQQQQMPQMQQQFPQMQQQQFPQMQQQMFPMPQQQMPQMTPQQMQQMFFQQQQQQQYMMMMQQQQQLYNKFLTYCNMTGTNPNDQAAFMTYCNMIQNNQMQNSQVNVQTNNNFPQPPINTMSKSQGNQVINPIPTQTTNDVYVNDPNQPKEIIPRKEETLYLNAAGGKSGPSQLSVMGMGNNNIINVTLTATSGLKVVIAAPKTMTFSQLFKNYVNKVGVPESVIGDKIVFLFNAEKLKVDSQEPISTLFKAFNANVTVLDQGNIIGA